MITSCSEAIRVGTYKPDESYVMCNHDLKWCDMAMDLSVAKQKPVTTVTTLMVPTILGWKHLQVSYPLVPPRPSAVVGRVRQSPVSLQDLEVLQNCKSYTGYFWLLNSAFWYLYWWEWWRQETRFNDLEYRKDTHSLLTICFAGLLHFFLRANQVWWSVWRLPRRSMCSHVKRLIKSMNSA